MLTYVMKELVTDKLDDAEEALASWSSCHHGRWRLIAYPLGLLL